MTDPPPFGGVPPDKLPGAPPPATAPGNVVPIGKPESGNRSRPRPDVPPHDPDAEQAILGAILRAAMDRPDLAADLVAQAPDPVCFYRPPHETLMRHMRRAVADGQPIDWVALLGRLTDAGDFRQGQLDGPALIDLEQKGAPPSSVPWHTERVQWAYRDRRRLEIVNRALQRLTTAPGPDARDAAWQDITAGIDTEATAATNGHHELTGAEPFLAAPDAEYDWAVPGLLERQDRLILTGGEGHGKSTLLRQLAVQTSSGIHPFGGSDYEPLTVLMVDVENTARQARRALRPLMLAAGLHYGGRLYIEVRPAGLDLAGDRHDVDWLLTLADAAHPDLLVIGPLYKLYNGNPNDEETAKPVATVLDRIRDEHSCAVMLEAHSPHAENRKGAERPLRPVGASLWMRWPEFGLHLGEQGAIRHWRGARDERDWPGLMARGGSWPWSPTSRPQDDLWARIKDLCQQAGDQLTYRDLEQITGASSGAVYRAISEHRAEWDALGRPPSGNDGQQQ